MARMWLDDAAIGRLLGDKLPVAMSHGESAPMPTVVDTQVIPIRVTTPHH